MRPSDAHIWVWGIAELKMQNKLASFGHRKARIRPLELALKERYLADVPSRANGPADLGWAAPLFIQPLYSDGRRPASAAALRGR